MDILYATDGSIPAREGHLLLSTLFERSRAHIHTFTVTPEADFEFAVPDPSFEPTGMGIPALGAEEVAQQAAALLAEDGFEVSSSSATGYPAGEILRMIEARRSELVILGASHTTWMGNLLLGSVSTYVLHHAPCSVLVAHRPPTGSGNVLVAVDGSSGSERALEMAMDVLDPSRCNLALATVISQPWVSVAAFPPGPPFGDFTEYHAAQKLATDRAWRLVERAAARAQNKGFKGEGTVLLGRPVPELLKEAENVRADLVVVGSRGLSTLRRGLLGSVSDQLVRHARATMVDRESPRG